MMEDLANSQSDSPLGSSVPDSKFSFLLKKKSLLIGMILLSIILIVPLFIFISSTLRSQKPSPAPKKELIAPGAPYKKDVVIVKYKDKYTQDEVLKLKARLEKIGVVSQEKIYDSDDPQLRNYYLLRFGERIDVAKTIEELEKLEEIEFAGPEYIMTTQVVNPNDPEFISGNMWGLSKIKMPEAWDITTGSDSITVAVIDTGIDYRHEDFVGRNIIQGPDFSTGDCVNERGNYDPPKPRDSDPMDDNGHGTHVSGTIGAKTHNLVGISGVNWNVSIVAIKALSKLGCAGATGDIGDAIVYAADNAKIINLSLGGPFSCDHQSALPYRVAIEHAISKGVIVVAAAGNNGKDANEHTPASCNGVITVGASDQSDQRSSWPSGGSSNWGGRVDIAAPGTGILSTILNNRYASFNGTSMAAPHVAGVAALLLSAYPNLSLVPSLTSELVRNCLVRNADDVVITDADKPIGPRLNADKALRNCDSGQPPPITSLTPSVTPALTLTPVQPGQLLSSISGNIFVDKNSNGIKDSDEAGPAGGAKIALVGSTNIDITSDTEGNFEFPNLDAGSYVVNMSIGSQRACSSSFNLPQNTTITLTCIISASGPGPSPIIVQPTILPTPTLEPSPTPVKTYTCRERSDAEPGKVGAIKIGDLICEPN